MLYNSQREPEEPDDPTKGRDVFNEKPSADELLAVSDIGKSVTTSLPDNVVSYSFICIYQINRIFRIGLRWISFSMSSWEQNSLGATMIGIVCGNVLSKISFCLFFFFLRRRF